jgi:hypothetical protein
MALGLSEGEISCTIGIATQVMAMAATQVMAMTATQVMAMATHYIAIQIIRRHF